MCAPATAFESKPYVVGRRYPIKMVYGRLYTRLGWWPVLGELHEDKDIVGFKFLHFHIDWRFASAGQLKFLERRECGARERAWYGVPLMLTERIGEGAHFTAGPRNYQTRVSRMTCKRDWLPYPHHRAGWQRRMKEAYADSCLVRGICPHRGYDLSHEPVIDGVVTCPLHGLRFDAATGRALAPDIAPKPPIPSAIVPEAPNVLS